MITNRDLQRLGMTRSQMDSAVRAGDARLVRPGVWSLDVGRTPEHDHRDLVRATWPGLRDGAVLSHASAAVLHGLPAPRGSLGRVHVTRPGRSGKCAGFLHVHRGIVDAEDVVRIEGMAVTGLARTIVDCSRWMGPMDGLALVDVALSRGFDRRVALDRVAKDGPRRGSARARVVIEQGNALSESAGESWSRWRMIELGIPLPALQVTLYDRHGEEVARPDFDWAEQGLVGEFDGAVKYGRLLGPGQDLADVILAEKAREERIRRQGRWVVRWTASDLFPALKFRDLMRDAWRAGIRAA